ncbi:MAG: DUF3105 domain-containing protein [Candidatus Dormibacteraeota bacterium]|nr:DUF3105 domain-containing protein [Candidatus Dormibacteraeota bacterium]
MRRFSFLLLLVLGLATACGSSSSPSGVTSVNFVGNDTCPTAGNSPYSPSPPDTNSAPVGQAIPEMPHVHVAPPTQVTYMHNPPTSGCHYSLGAGTAPISAGVHPPTPAIAPEYWVHNLEHGYVVISYNCPTGCLSDLQTLNTWYQSLPADAGGGVPYAKVIVVPDPAQKETFDVESWDWFDPIGATLNMGEVTKFYNNHVNQSPEGASTP